MTNDMTMRERKLEWLRIRMKLIPKNERTEKNIKILAVRMKHEKMYSPHTYIKDIMTYIENTIRRYSL